MTEQKREYDRKWREDNKDYLKSYNNSYRKENKEKLTIRRHEWRRDNKDKMRRISLKVNLRRNHGITPDDYATMLLKQNGCCAICGKSASEYKRKLHIDHNHSTGQIRGLLCVRCNYGIGCFKETPSFLDKAKEYLIFYNGVQNKI
jgi:hypothetical protein